LFKKAIKIVICVIAAIGVITCAQAFYTDGGDDADDRSEDIFNSRQKNSYEAQLGLVPEKNALGSLGGDSMNYTIEETIIDMKKEKKKIIQRAKAEALETSRLARAQKEHLLKERNDLIRKTAARQRTEQGLQKIMIAQGVFVILCLAVMWFIMSQPAES